MNAEVVQLRPAILIISETAFHHPSTDRSENILCQSFRSEGGDKWAEPLVEVVPDDAVKIELAIRRWVDDAKDLVNLVVTTGGTGFSTKDITPEVLTPLIDRPAPGLVHAMLAASLQITSFAAMARPVAGVRGRSLILALPGSPKGAKENLEAVLKLLPHACLQAAGGDSRAMHAGGVKRLEKEAAVSAAENRSSASQTPSQHHQHLCHGHDSHQVPKAHTKPEDRAARSNDLRLGVTQRHRSSRYPMLSVSNAVALILENGLAAVRDTQPLSLALVGHVVSSDIHALEEVPSYRASIVDGYAVMVPAGNLQPSLGVKGTFPVASVSHAQASSMPPPLAEGTVSRITTGAPMPANANAVVMVEDTTVVRTTDDGSEEASIEILTDATRPGENIREPGSDIKFNSLILSQGTPITSLGGEIGVLAAAGVHSVPVFRRARVGVLSTGDEVTDISYHDQPLQGGQIRDSNRPSLLSLLQGWNLCSSIIDLGIARDTPRDSLETALRTGFGVHDLDVIITTGGVSMGELDLLKPTVERSMDGTVHFGRVSMKPGKPTTFASVTVKRSGSSSSLSSGQECEKRKGLIFGLPGNPASAIVTANLFVLPALQKMAGIDSNTSMMDQGETRARTGLERVMVRVEERVRCDGARVEYHRVRVRCGSDGLLRATSTGFQRSSRVGSLASANALLVLPQKEGTLEPGEMCEALMMGPIVGF